MSHFTCLVAVPPHTTLDDVMLPFHEYECTGIEEYIEFVPEDMEELQKDFEKHGEEGETIEHFAKDWCDATPNEDGILGRMTNPNAHWDWFVVGGRWSGYFHPDNAGPVDEWIPYLRAEDTENTWEASTYAFIDEEGNWHHKGRMGWWGMTAEENKDEYNGENGEFWTFIRNLDPDTHLVLVDCHI